MKRRIVIAFLSTGDFISAFVSGESGFPLLREPGSINVLKRVRLVGVPADCVVNYGWYDAVRDCFGLRIEHPSFDEIDEGEIPPTVTVQADYFFCDFEGKLLQSGTDTQVEGTWLTRKGLL